MSSYTPIAAACCPGAYQRDDQPGMGQLVQRLGIGKRLQSRQHRLMLAACAGDLGIAQRYIEELLPQRGDARVAGQRVHVGQRLTAPEADRTPVQLDGGQVVAGNSRARWRPARPAP